MTSENSTDLRYLQLLAQQYPTIRAASTEIINLNAQQQLPKGTEHFLSDIHGEYEPFIHVLKNGSGSIRRRLDEVFADALLEREKRNLATLIYYPEKKLPLILEELETHDEWYRITLFRLIKLCRSVASKYTRAQVRRALPDDFAYIIEELLHEQESHVNRNEYYSSIIDTIIDIGRAQAFITAVARLIQRLAIAHLHIIGDVFDRGPGAHIIMDTLMAHHSVDFQWGNHDIVWMGAAAGSDACLANVVRICLRYLNMETLENGYAISLLPLASFAMEAYRDDPCAQFRPKGVGDEYTENELRLIAQMHKAITIIQLKLESQLIMRRPNYQMRDRLLLHKIDFERGIITLADKEYDLLDTHFPTIDARNPYQLTEKEQQVVDRLRLSFANSEKLQKHVRFLFSAGSMYLVHNGNLLYHGCIPMTEEGELRTFVLDGREYGPKAFMDRMERLARQGYFTTQDTNKKQYGMDVMWYLWTGAQSPLFGKDKMTTFERYFIEDASTHTEKMNPYYSFRDDEDTINAILRAFDLDPETSHIVNGHVPVKVKKGESPVKAGGKLLVIDGGFAKAYQARTGIAGYTLIYNSYGLLLAAHQPFESTQRAIEEERDIDSETIVLERNVRRIRVRDTDKGQEIRQRIDDLKGLLEAYRTGLIKES